MLKKLIINSLRDRYNIEAVELELLSLGADMTAKVYKACSLDQSCYFIKLRQRSESCVGATIPLMLWDEGIKQVIPPIKTVNAQAICRAGDFTMIVYPFIEGEDGFTRTLTADQWCVFGKVLREIHDFDVPASIIAQLRRETFSPKWREAVRSFYIRIEAGFSNDSLTVDFLKFMKEHGKTIQNLVDRADYFGKILQKQSFEFVLCHSDIHGGNILIANDHGIHIVDWDAPIIAPKERDLMFIGGGVANVWNQLHEEEAFYRGYGNTSLNREAISYYRYERIVEDIAEYIQGLLDESISYQDRQLMLKYFLDMFASNGVVDIALKTDPAF